MNTELRQRALELAVGVSECLMRNAGSESNETILARAELFYGFMTKIDAATAEKE